MKVLITGASGFTGNYMSEYLAPKKNCELFGLVHKHAKNHSVDIELIGCDLHNRKKVESVIQEIIPDRIIHLAGLNHGSFSDLLQTNVLGTENLLHAVNNEQNKCRVLIISSSAEYGYSDVLPIKESSSLNPISEYGVSKVAENLLSMSYYHRFGLQVAVARPFNLIGPGQPSSFVCGQIISQIVEIEKGNKTSLDLREIESCRDFIDVRDAVAAYWSIVDHKRYATECAGNVFNVGSGKCYSISNVLEIIWETLKRKYPVTISKNSGTILIPRQQSDNSLILKTTSWQPKIELKESISDMLRLARKLK
jgi:GDP-4-dehydro-6-deoxy-D-mannose reductase